MKLNDFNFDLPEHLIAQHPCLKRDESRLLIYHYKSNKIEDKHFYDIIDYLNKDDVLVLNDSKVIPARLFGFKPETGAKCEVLILKIENDICKCLCGNAKVIKVGTKIVFSDNLQAICKEVKEEGIRILQFIYDGIFLEVLSQIGSMPLPPYIHEKLKDTQRYQNVYAKYDGSSACPTAGLHFTKELLEKIKNKGIKVCYVTLHVGLGTFKPVKVENIFDHNMHFESYSMSQETADILNNAKDKGNRIIAVGTTSTRVLETIMTKYETFKQCFGETNIFIYPGYIFKAITCQITNFHLPKSTLIMMISALCGKDNILNTYKHAIDNEYRFFSFGDSMFIVND